MGTDDLFHKRKKSERRFSTLGRRSFYRKENKRILIICEDEKSSRYYFEGFCLENNLVREVKVIKCPNGNDPLNIIKYAEKERKYYQKIYCVFDADVKFTSEKNEKRYQEALNKCKNSKDKIIAIDSMPNFEYWLLLHFDCYSAPFARTEKNTIDEMATKKLKEYLPNYEKKDKNIFTKTKDYLKAAMKNAHAVEKNHKQTDSDNPSTKIHKLIRELLTLKK